MLKNLLGGTCFLCRGAAREPLCEGCECDLPRIDALRCPRCALPSPEGVVCGRCIAHPPPLDAAVAAADYAFPADAMVLALKFRGELALAPVLARLLAERIGAAEAIDCVIPVPLSAARLRSRGYNQALEIARHLGRGAPDFSLCTRERDTPAQADLPLAQRARNVRGAFACVRRVDGARIAVVDDVMTTGATLNEVAVTLKRAGAARVVGWVVARTPAPD